MREVVCMCISKAIKSLKSKVLTKFGILKMNNIPAKYSLLSLEEPTEDQLQIIMLDALV